MGCCHTKEAVAEDQQDVSHNGSAASPATASKAKAKKGAASSHESAKSADSGGASSQPTGKKSVPAAPSGAIQINVSEAAPPGWGGTPEVEEVEDVEIELAESGPRAARNIGSNKGYISGTRKDQDVSEGVMDRIRGLEDAGLQTKKKMGLKMLTPRIITDVKETWDKEGNLTRHMKHFIEEPDGTKHTKTETCYIAAGDPDPMAPEPAAEAE